MRQLAIGQEPRHCWVCEVERIGGTTFALIKINGTVAAAAAVDRSRDEASQHHDVAKKSCGCDWRLQPQQAHRERHPRADRDRRPVCLTPRVLQFATAVSTRLRPNNAKRASKARCMSCTRHGALVRASSRPRRSLRRTPSASTARNASQVARTRRPHRVISTGARRNRPPRERDGRASFQTNSPPGSITLYLSSQPACSSMP